MYLIIGEKTDSFSLHHKTIPEGLFCLSSRGLDGLTCLLEAKIDVFCLPPLAALITRLEDIFRGYIEH